MKSDVRNYKSFPTFLQDVMNLGLQRDKNRTYICPFFVNSVLCFFGLPPFTHGHRRPVILTLPIMVRGGLTRQETERFPGGPLLQKDYRAPGPWLWMTGYLGTWTLSFSYGYWLVKQESKSLSPDALAYNGLCFQKDSHNKMLFF